MLSFQHTKAANSEPQTVPLTKTYPDPQPNKRGHRIPDHPILCIIQEDGITSTISLEEIISYEIRDIEGLVCIATFTDEIEFTYYLFTYPGEYQIRLLAEDYYFVGEISTL